MLMEKCCNKRNTFSITSKQFLFVKFDNNVVCVFILQFVLDSSKSDVEESVFVDEFSL